MIQLNNVTKSYGTGILKNIIFSDLNIHITSGMRVAIAGPSGSGKSTLLNIIGCLDTIDSGDVHIFNTNVSTMSSQELTNFRKNMIGFVFQSFHLIPVLSAYENVALILSLFHMNKYNERQKVMQCLDAVGLADLANRRPNQLSGGQQQRVAIARALVKEPKLIIADEPTANLDSTIGLEMLDLLEQISIEQGATVVFSTHDEKVMKRAERLIYFRDGVIEYDT